MAKMTPLIALHSFFFAAQILIGLFLVKPLAFIVPALKRRIDFENSDHGDHSHSFNDVNLQAEMAFEVSSVGELEQIFPLLKECLESQKNIELIYSSSSLQHKIDDLCAVYSNLRVYRLRVVTSFLPSKSLFKWVSAKRLILCRYDFYPELILLGKLRCEEFILLNATLKGKESILSRHGHILRSYYQLLFNGFDLVVTATTTDSHKFSKLGVANIYGPYDFRIEQINSRLKCSETTLSRMDDYSTFSQLYSQFDPAKTVIFGSCWPVDMNIFKSSGLVSKVLSAQYLVVLAPHELDDLSVQDIKSAVAEINPDLPTYTLGEFTLDQFFENPGIIIVKWKGVLCEFYSMFTHAYIGGGFGRSIHSVLEPFVAGCYVYCGPRVHRSTEWEYINSVDSSRVRSIDNFSDFLLYEQAQFCQHIDIDYNNLSFPSSEEIRKKIYVES